MIRNATEADISHIKEFMQAEPGFWQDWWQPDVLERAIQSANGLAFVWEERGQLLGFACAHDLGFRAYLSELIVHPEARGQGIARKLIEHVQKSLTERGCRILISDVWKDAVGFYRELGWSEPDVVLLRKRL